MFHFISEFSPTLYQASQLILDTRAWPIRCDCWKECVPRITTRSTLFPDALHQIRDNRSTRRLWFRRRWWFVHRFFIIIVNRVSTIRANYQRFTCFVNHFVSLRKPSFQRAFGKIKETMSRIKTPLSALFLWKVFSCRLIIPSWRNEQCLNMMINFSMWYSLTGLTLYIFIFIKIYNIIIIYRLVLEQFFFN